MKKSILAKFLALILCLSMVMGSLTVVMAEENADFESVEAISAEEEPVLGEPPADAVPLTAGTAAAVPEELSESDSWFSFVPEKTGSYYLRTSAYVYAWVYDSDMGNIDNDECIYQMGVDLDAGVTYYIKTRVYDEKEAYTLTVQYNNNLYAWADDEANEDRETEWYYSAKPNSDVTLAVAVSRNDTDSDVFYQWYLYDGDNDEKTEQEGATQASFTVENIQRPAEYICEVRDTYGSRTEVMFVVQIRHFRVDDPEVVYVKSGEDATLQVVVEKGYEDEEISYQWYYEEMPVPDDPSDTCRGPIEGETSDTLIVENVTRSTDFYSCTVQNQNGFKKVVRFSIMITSSLQVLAETGEYDEDRDAYVVYGEPGKELELKVNASSDEGAVIGYSWTDSAGDNLGSNTDTCKILPVKSETFTCEVSDGIANPKRIKFYVVAEPVIEEGTEVFVSEEDSEERFGFRFIPEKDGKYRFVSSTYLNVHIDKEAEYMDSLYWVDNEIIELQAGVTYHFYTRISDEPEAYSFRISAYFDNGLRAWVDADGYRPGDTYANFSVKPGGSIDLSVAVSMNDENSEITCQWSRLWYSQVDDEDPQYTVLEETGSTLTISNPKEGAYYRCKVKDNHDSPEQEVRFEVWVDSGLSVSADKTKIDLAPREEAVLSVNVTPGIEEGLTCVWTEAFSSEALATQTTTLTVGGKTQGYVFTVTDQYGNYKDIYFDVRVNHFSVTSNAGEDETVAVMPGEAAVLQVAVQADDPAVTYRWYKWGEVWVEEEDDGYWDEDYVLLPETGDSITVQDPKDNEEYKCEVTDQYGNTATRCFVIKVKHFSVKDPENGGELRVKKGENALLKVNAAKAFDEEVLTYEWQWWNPTDTEEFQPIPGSTDSDSYTVENVQGHDVYRCIVKNQYGYQREVWFRVDIDSNLQVTVGSGVYNEAKEAYVIYAEHDSQVELSVSATTESDLNLDYYWDYDDSEGTSITIGPLTGPEYVACTVSDGYMQETVWFEVYVENGFSVTPQGRIELPVKLGDPVTLTVNVTADDKEGLTCTWLRGHSWYEWEPVVIATGTLEYTIDAVRTADCHYSDDSEGVYYGFVARDRYGNTASTSFYLAVENHLEASAENTAVIVPYDEDVTLQVAASADEMDGISYLWYEENVEYYKELSSENPCVIENVKEDIKNLKCRVTDKYGNAKTVEFEVTVCKDHTPAEAVRENETAATCTNAGSYEEVVKCSKCGKEISRKTVTIPAAHKLTKVNAKSATLTAAGNIEYYKCSACKKLFTDAKGTKETTKAKVTIAKLINIKSAKVTGIKNKAYTGKAITQSPKVVLNKVTLKNGTDYKVTYKNNKKVGTATMTITGLGKYGGSLNKTFTISKAANPITLKVTSKTYKQKNLKSAKSFSIGVTRAQGSVSYTALASAKKAGIKVTSKGKVTVPKNCKTGTYIINVKAAGNKNYKAATKKVTIIVK